MTFSLKRLLLGFWSVWWTVVLLTNVADAAKALGVLKDHWAFASGNYHYICETTARYGTPVVVNAVLFAAVIIWQAVATVLFWRAFRAYRNLANGRPAVHRAFAVGLSLWLAFMVADEIFIGYAVEAAHLRLFVAQLVTLLAVELLPEDR